MSSDNTYVTPIHAIFFRILSKIKTNSSSLCLQPASFNFHLRNRYESLDRASFASEYLSDKTKLNCAQIFRRLFNFVLVASYEIKETEGIIGDCVTEYLPFFHHLFNNIGFTAPYVLHAINAIHVDEIFFKCSDCSCDDCKSRTKKKS